MKKIKNIILKKNKTKIVCLTAYSKNIAKILDKYCDIVLVGDSMANVLYALKDTNQINLSTIIQHTKSVKQGVKKSLLVVDMPKNSYKNKTKAIRNAKLIMKLTKCDAVKLESNNKNFKIKSIFLKSDKFIHPSIIIVSDKNNKKWYWKKYFLISNKLKLLKFKAIYYSFEWD